MERHLRPAPRQVELHTEWGRLTYLEQTARLPNGRTQLVKWHGFLDGEPIDRDRLEKLVMLHALVGERCDHTYHVPLCAGVAEGQPCTKCGEAYRMRRSA